MDKNTDNISSSCRITIVGTGNVGTHLAKALRGKRYDVSLIGSRTLTGLPDKSDIIIIAVKDDAIAETAKRLKGKAGLIAHTSGSVPMAVLEGTAKATGVFYPMQTFSKDVELNYSDIPFFIEGNSEEAENALLDVARSVSGNVRLADSADRKRLHLSAVFACNFTNHLMAIADDILKENGMDYSVMLPLLRQTIDKLQSLPPSKAQTGPAARLDRNVLDAHIDMLKGERHLRDLYEEMTAQIILKTHNNRIFTLSDNQLR